MMGYDVLLQPKHPVPPRDPEVPFGQRAAEAVARTVGSWRFILLQSFALSAWVVVNAMWQRTAWDPYPFILLNLMLSLQAAYTAPMILMAQNRQAEKDREILHEDFRVDQATGIGMTEVLSRVERMEKKLDDIAQGIQSK